RSRHRFVGSGRSRPQNALAHDVALESAHFVSVFSHAKRAITLSASLVGSVSQAHLPFPPAPRPGSTENSSPARQKAEPAKRHQRSRECPAAISCRAIAH